MKISETCILSHEILDKSDKRCLETLKRLVDKYRMKDGFIALELGDFDSLLSAAESVQVIEVKATGEDSAVGAVIAAAREHDLGGASHILISFLGSPDAIGVEKICEATTALQEQAPPNAEIVFGATADEHMANTVQAVIVAGMCSKES